MEEQTQSLKIDKITKNLFPADNPKRLLLTILGISIVLGIISGYILSSKGQTSLTAAGLPGQAAKNPQSDARTFRDFAEGTIKAKPLASDGEYSEGTHSLEREGAVPVALTSSVVDLSQYEGKKVKVFGETQKALKEGWLMDVGRVEEIK